MTRIKFAFRNKHQLPFFMIWKEWYENGEIVFAKVLFSITGREEKWRKRYRKENAHVDPDDDLYCVCCGEYCGEGRQICVKCEKEASDEGH